MATVRNQCYVVESADELPIHLNDRSPFVLKDTEMALRFPRGEVFGTGGRVKMVGAIEFQSKISPGTLTDICDPDELYTREMADTHRFRCVYDPELQRGVKETPKGPKEYLRESQIDSMMRDIEGGQFECPQLIWNLRANQTIWAYINSTRELRIYEGIATRPDTNHRHHAIVRFHRRYQRWVAQTGSDKMGAYNPTRQYGLVIYTDDYQGEAHRSYVYNALGWKVSSSTASYLESKTQSPNVHVKLARELMERSPVLGHANVEILKNNLQRNSAKMVSFGTLSNGIREAFPELTDEYYQDVLNQLVRLVGELHKLRPNEIANLDVSRRKRVRETSLADSSALWSAYFKIAERIFSGKFSDWEEKLPLLNANFVNGTFSGDFFSPHNPAWEEHGVVVLTSKGPQIRSNPQARRGAYDLVSSVLGISEPQATGQSKGVKNTAISDEEKSLQKRLTNGATDIPARPAARPAGTKTENHSPVLTQFGLASSAQPKKEPALIGQIKKPVSVPSKPKPVEPARPQNRNSIPDEGEKRLEKLMTTLPATKK